MILDKYLQQFDLKYCITVDGDRFKGDMIPSYVTLREIAPNELIIEFDIYRERSLMLIKQAERNLKRFGLGYKIYDHKGRSPHIHVYSILGLEDIDYDIRSVYKKILVSNIAPHEDTDLSLCSNGLIAMEDRPHFKHGTIKKLIRSWGTFDNDIDIDILTAAYNIVNRKDTIDVNRPDFNNNFMLSWILSFPGYQHNMDIWMFKNVAITLVNDNYNITAFCDKFGDVYGSSRVNHLYGWIRWAKQHRRYFCLKEIINFCEMYELEWKNVMKEYKQKPYKDTNHEQR